MQNIVRYITIVTINEKTFGGKVNMKITPLFDRVVIEPVDAEEKTKSGIVLLAKDQEKPQMAKSLRSARAALLTARTSKCRLK